MQERVLQECELIIPKYWALPKNLRSSGSTTPVRTLSESELTSFLEHSTLLDDPATVAVIVFLEPSLDEVFSSHASSEPVASFIDLQVPPSLHTTSPRQYVNDDLLQPHRIPVYRASRILPDPVRREILRTLLEKLCPKVTKTLNHVPGPSDPTAPRETVFVIRNPLVLLEYNLDTTSLAVALWRLRLWEGEGWVSLGTSRGVSEFQPSLPMLVSRTLMAPQ